MSLGTSKHQRGSSKTCDATQCCPHRLHRRASARGFACALALACAAALLASPALADEMFQETHAFSIDFDSPAFDSVFEYNIDLPLFDTAGGTRELVAFEVDYYLGRDYTYAMNSNPTANWVGCNIEWTQVWSSMLDGQPWFPLDQPPDHQYLDSTAGTGAVVAPLFEGTEPASWATGVGHSETQTEPDLLARLTGVGFATIECTHTLSAATYSLPNRGWPAGLPEDQRVFDPDLFDLTIDRIVMDVTVIYYWVPEPGTLALVICGAPLLLRRR